MSFLALGILNHICKFGCLWHPIGSPFGSVQPKPGFGIGNRNQDQVSVSVLEPKLFVPKPKLPLFYFSRAFCALF